MRIPIRHRILVSPIFIWIALSLTMVSAQPNELDLAQVVAKLQNRLQQAQGLSLEVELRTAKGNRIIARIMAMRPNYYRVETENQSFYCDGTSAWQYFPLKAVYMPFWKDDQGMFIPLATGFDMYSPESRFKPDYNGVEEAVFEGKRVIALAKEPKDMPNLRIRIFIDPESWLPVGSDQKMLDNVDVSIYRNVQIDRHFTPADFAWRPPKGAIDDSKIKSDGPKPLQAGDVAPEFELPLTNGKHISLRKALKGKKGLLVNFWFINCGYCLLEMPQLADLYRNAKDLEIIAINDTDTLDEIRKFVQKPNYQFPVAIDEGALVAEAYKLKGWGRPITFLILPDGTVAYVQVGYDTENKLAKLEEELVKLGIIHETPHK
jgi:peroxiredoxin/outer membrane lipoprotein-sorting protein